MVGTIATWVSSCSAMSVSIVAMSNDWRITTSAPPAGAASVAAVAMTWNSGDVWYTRASGSATRYSACVRCNARQTPSCRCSTALGRPLVPPVYMSSTGSSGAGSAGGSGSPLASSSASVRSAPATPSSSATTVPTSPIRRRSSSTAPACAASTNTARGAQSRTTYSVSSSERRVLTGQSTPAPHAAACHRSKYAPQLRASTAKRSSASCPSVRRNADVMRQARSACSPTVPAPSSSTTPTAFQRAARCARAIAG